MAAQTIIDRSAILEEYRQLKSEIGEWSRVRNQFIGVSLTAAAALFGLGFQWKNPFIFLAALLVQLPTMAICNAASISILTISGYIQTMIEPNVPDLNWETMIAKAENTNKRSWVHPLTAGVDGLAALPALLSLGFAGVFWPWKPSDSLFRWVFSLNGIFLVVAAIVLLSIFLFWRNSVRGSSIRKDALQRWMSLKASLGTK
jgi:hypothetical protein